MGDARWLQPSYQAAPEPRLAVQCSLRSCRGWPETTGNTLNKTNAGAVTQYTWDLENHLNSVGLPAGQCRSKTILSDAEYIYKGLNLSLDQPIT